VDGPIHHGTIANLVMGDLLVAGHSPNFEEGRTSNHIYFSSRLETTIRGAELSVTNKKFPGNPTRSFRTREPFRIVGIVEDWHAHSAEVLQGMLDSLQSLKRRGLAIIED
jgi:rifampin ADP-ribosylating transferase